MEAWGRQAGHESKRLEISGECLGLGWRLWRIARREGPKRGHGRGNVKEIKKTGAGGRRHLTGAGGLRGGADLLDSCLFSTGTGILRRRHNTRHGRWWFNQELFGGLETGACPWFPRLLFGDRNWEQRRLAQVRSDPPGRELTWRDWRSGREERCRQATDRSTSSGKKDWRLIRTGLAAARGRMPSSGLGADSVYPVIEIQLGNTYFH